MKQSGYKSILDRYEETMELLTINVMDLEKEEVSKLAGNAIAFYRYLEMNQQGDALALNDLFGSLLVYDRAAGWCVIDKNGQKQIDHDKQRKVAVLTLACLYEHQSILIRRVNAELSELDDPIDDEMFDLGEEVVEKLAGRAWDLRTNKRIDEVLEIAALFMR